MKFSSLIICWLNIFLPLSVFAQVVSADTIPGTSVRFELVLIPGGIFKMGASPDDKQRRPNEEPQRLVKVDSLWMGRFEVTYDEFSIFYHREQDNEESRHPNRVFRPDAVTRPTPQYMDYTYGMGKEGFPAVGMTQQAALRYCYWLYEKTGHFYRLPTEAEWEYACKAGIEKPDYQPLEDYAWFYDNSFEKYHRPGQKKPNPWGLYDMLGNVAEWTLDFYEEQYLGQLEGEPAVNPWKIPLRRHSRTVKGGSYDSRPEQCRCSYRQASDPRWQARDPQIPKSRWWNPDSPFLGFRLVRPLVTPDEPTVRAFFEKAIKD